MTVLRLLFCRRCLAGCYGVCHAMPPRRILLPVTVTTRRATQLQASKQADEQALED